MQQADTKINIIDDNSIEQMSIPSTPNYCHVKENGFINTGVEDMSQVHCATFHTFDRFDLLKETPEMVAEQLTRLCGHLFTQIQPEEFTNCNWEKKDKFSKAPCICEFQDFFNRTCAWVTKSILNLEITEKHRADIITQFIKIAKKLLEFKNFHSFMAIIISLERRAIIRLKRTWKKVDGRKAFDNMTEVISHSNNYEKLWDHMKRSSPPCIPYLGIYTKRFVELSAASDLSLSECQEPLEVYDQLVSQLGYYQRSIVLYEFKENPKLKSSLQQQLQNCYLNEFERFFETDVFKLSLQIEAEELDSIRTLRPTNSNPLTPHGSPRKCATIPRKRSPLIIGASNKMALDNRCPTPPEFRAIGQFGILSPICNPLNVSTSTLPTDFQISKKIGHRKIKSYGGSTNRTETDPFGALNPVSQCLSIPKEYPSTLSPDDASSLRSNNTSSGSSDSGSFGDGFEISDCAGECKPILNGTGKQPVSFISGVKLKLKDNSKLKLCRSHKYLLQLYENEIVFTRKHSHLSNIEKYEIPISELPKNICEIFEKDKRIYLHTNKSREIRIKPRIEDFTKFQQILKYATSFNKFSHPIDLIDLNL
ncbi:Ras-specific guanine nucleotide-releasing factor RalGPS1-like isoform X1 [Oopsacas minuta]|uniref:Ras-specific guanine nucleotide-releasing factor RalGPS1-like isoform X1 n=1 Tax=Oopsacas minuta TaxID=111878 RepID=A0AAV7JK61_9METZ|nr:Ras-specific guanine nucleotide-releasing factor RalGPS1-like isoform X1 [Oopsacas minuta]